MVPGKISVMPILRRYVDTDTGVKGENMKLSVIEISKCKVIKPAGRIDWESAQTGQRNTKYHRRRILPRVQPG